MKKSKLIAAIGGLTLAAVATVFIAADHIDSPSVVNGGADIADLYAFEGENPDNTVFIATLPAMTLPAGSPAIDFDESVLVEFNIDTTGDGVEDFVLQAIPRDGVMYFFGPYATTADTTGKVSTIDTNAQYQSSVNINGAPVTSTDGLSYYAGTRNDAFFFDFEQFNNVKQGPDVAPNGFDQADEASDLFSGLNVNAIVVEVPNFILGDGAPHGAGTGVDVYNVWVETKRQ